MSPLEVIVVSMQISHTADKEYMSCYTHQQTDISSHAVNTCDVCPTLQAVITQYHVMSPLEVVVVSIQISHTADKEYMSCYTHQQTDISSHAVNTCDVCPTLQAVNMRSHSINKLQNGIRLLVVKI